MWVGVGLNFSMSSHDVVPAGDSRETIMGGTLLNGGKIKELLLVLTFLNVTRHINHKKKKAVANIFSNIL